MKHVVAFLVAAFVAFPAWAEVDIQEVTSPGGLKAWLVEEPSIPFVALEIQFQGGASLDVPGKRGSTILMTSLLEEGAGELDARAFARRGEELAASFGFDASDDNISVTARFLTETQDEAIELLRAALQEPRFDDDAIERVRRQLLTNIRSDETDPRALARRAFDAAAYGDHPYATSPDGTEDSVSALTRDDLVTAHHNAFARDRVVIGAAGNIDAETLGRVIDAVLGDLPESGAPMPTQAEVSITGGIEVVPFDTPQSVAIFGHAGVERDHPDFFAAYLLNQVLGAGGFESRLTQEVRVKRGLTYGVYSYLSPKDYAATYQGSVSSANDRIAEAVDVIRDEWSKIAENGVTEEELNAAKLYLTGAYPLRFDGNSNIAGILVGMQAQGLPIDYIATRNDKVNAVTLEEANAVAKWLYQPDNLRFVVVGTPEGLETTASN
ncbi:insulinase family protein [Aliishimia ponticola]|uniref:Insulinase family protein n=1 Tax=Aliishimia ponticola TaxID=2499833 RepID=A0A4V6S221_9RHOB|nr:pitrilysin family protein [Aliishimia ponticola]THH36753.1 insulinase family protein [Aliishimia ponticola]